MYEATKPDYKEFYTIGLELAEDDPDAPALAVYGYLGFLLSEVVDALTEGLPPPIESEI